MALTGAAGVRKWKELLDVVATVAVTVAAIGVLWSTWTRASSRPSTAPSEAPIPTVPVVLGSAPTRGVGAKVAVLVYSDFECPYCGQFAREVLPAINKEFVSSGKVLLAFRHFPLRGIHRAAMDAARYTECANREGKFWALHDSLFASPGKLDTHVIRRLARESGVDEALLDKCIAGDVDGRIEADIKEAKAFGVTGTPTVLLGIRRDENAVTVKERFTGVQSASALGESIRRLLARSGS